MSEKSCNFAHVKKEMEVKYIKSTTMDTEIINDNIIHTIESFRKDVSVYRRYASFDFCYGYFQTYHGKLTQDNELACMHLWSYLASWGMLRGSSILLQEKSMMSLSPLIDTLDTLGEDIWNLDVPQYTDENIDKIVNTYTTISNCLSNEVLGKAPTITLVTKIMLGTLGCIPAFDTNFIRSFSEEFRGQCGFTVVNEKALQCIYQFYLNHQTALDKLHYPVINCKGASIPDLNYSIAKLIDMYGFSK